MAKAIHVETKSLVHQKNGSSTLSIKKNVTPVTDGEMTVKYYKDYIILRAKESK